MSRSRRTSARFLALLPALLVSVLAAAACGKYGPPVRVERAPVEAPADLPDATDDRPDEEAQP